MKYTVQITKEMLNDCIAREKQPEYRVCEHCIVSQAISKTVGRVFLVSMNFFWEDVPMSRMLQLPSIAQSVVSQFNKRDYDSIPECSFEIEL